jgi:hypothetical protein
MDFGLDSNIGLHQPFADDENEGWWENGETGTSMSLLMLGVCFEGGVLLLLERLLRGE